MQKLMRPGNRVNWEIKNPSVRLIGKNNEQLGIVAIDMARKIASENELDLVEVVNNTNPIVCKIMDYSKFKYEQKVKEKELNKKKRETSIDLKELRLGLNIADHDVYIKIEQAKKFLANGDRVQFTVRIRGQREFKQKDKGFEVLNKVIESLKDFSIVEKNPKMESSKLIICCLLPKK